jgi:phosphoglycolate phosphatase
VKASALIASRRALVFDLDGTLADTITDLWLALNAALQDCGLPPVGVELVQESLHGGLPETVRAVTSTLSAGPGVLPELSRRYAVHYQQRAHAASSLYAGVVDLLDACRNRRIPLAVCTNKSRDAAMALLTRLAIADRFQCVVGGDSADHPKPHPAPLLFALRELATGPGQAVMIGDSHVDAECAARAGVDFVLHTGGYGVAEAGPYPVAARFDSYRELALNEH